MFEGKNLIKLSIKKDISEKMTKPSQGSSEINDIVREQIQLVKTERELTALIDKVNDQINQLLVCIFRCQLIRG